MNIGESNLVIEVSLLLFLRMLEASVDLNSLTRRGLGQFDWELYFPRRWQSFIALASIGLSVGGMTESTFSTSLCNLSSLFVFRGFSDKP